MPCTNKQHSHGTDKSKNKKERKIKMLNHPPDDNPHCHNAYCSTKYLHTENRRKIIIIMKKPV